MVNSCILTALLAVAPTAQTQAPDATSSSDIIIIDGKKDPSQLPEWAVWEQGFTIIAGWQGRDSGFTHDLRTALSKDEFDMLEHEASTQSERLNQASLEAEPLRVLYAHRDPKDAKLLASLNDRMQDINLKYRRATLEARNRLLEALSPESQSVLASWIGDIRAGIVARVAKADLERWRAPE